MSLNTCLLAGPPTGGWVIFFVYDELVSKIAVCFHCCFLCSQSYLGILESWNQLLVDTRCGFDLSPSVIDFSIIAQDWEFPTFHNSQELLLVGLPVGTYEFVSLVATCNHRSNLRPGLASVLFHSVTCRSRNLCIKRTEMRPKCSVLTCFPFVTLRSKIERVLRLWLQKIVTYLKWVNCAPYLHKTSKIWARRVTPCSWPRN